MSNNLIEYETNLMNMFKQESKVTSVNNNAYNYHKWFLNNAKLFNLVNVKESRQLSKHAKIKKCFDNCYKLSFKNPNLKYVEGLTFSIIPLEHAFLINDKNEVIDPTLAINTEYSKNRFGSEYLGVEIPTNLLFKLLSQKKKWYVSLLYSYYEYVTKGDYKNGS